MASHTHDAVCAINTQMPAKTQVLALYALHTHTHTHTNHKDTYIYDIV